MVTVCSSLIGLAARYRLHQACKAKYRNFVFNTRCVVFCLPGRSSESSDSDKEANGETVENGDTSDHSDSEKDPDRPPSWFQAQSHKTRLLQYYGDSYSSGLKADIQDFISSIFWILESKRVEYTQTGENGEKEGRA